MTFDDWFRFKYGKKEYGAMFAEQRDELEKLLREDWDEASYHAYANGYETAIGHSVQICDSVASLYKGREALSARQCADSIRALNKPKP